MNKTLWTGLTCLGVFLFETKGHCTPSLKFSHVVFVFFLYSSYLPIKMDAKTQEIEPGLCFFFFLNGQVSEAVCKRD